MDLSKTAILLTAHPRQQKWWSSVLLPLDRYAGPLVLAYDDIDIAPIPTEIVARFACIATTGRPAGQLGHGVGELVCIQLGLRVVLGLGCDYVLKLGFDEPPWRWRNLVELAAEIDAKGLDVIDCETRVFFGRPGPLSRAMDQTDCATRVGGSAESYWTWACGHAGIKRRRTDDRLWWETKLGLLHLQGEYAANLGHHNAWSWQIGELWPR